MDPVAENERLRRLLAEQKDALAAAIERNAALQAELEAAKAVAARLERDVKRLERRKCPTNPLRPEWRQLPRYVGQSA